jgi:2-keto-4-pentenoate hydratase/2-oxohepta-3-ene-1,7-dioic acid hydratase in catechol pathway
MKFATASLNGNEQVGLVREAERRFIPVQVASMVGLIERYDELRSALANLSGGVDLDQVRFAAPIPNPRRNIICVGKNYRDHAREFAQSGYEAGAVKGAEIDPFPAVFTKPASTVVASGATVDLHPEATSSVDYEGELAVIIGKPGKNISRARAMDHIWGYCIVNDVTARDRQKNHKQWFLGKALDTFCPMGPWITTRDEVDIGNLQLQTWVNGELRQNANTRDLIFDIPSLLETISLGMALVPGDIIATGTPAGVGLGFDPPKFLKKGDEVVVKIQGLGTLANTFE